MLFTLSLLIVGLGTLIAGIFVLLGLRDKLRTDSLSGKWKAVVTHGKMEELQTAKEVNITVLFDWEVGDGKYIGDAGVSYLVEADKKKILFDLGDSYGRKNSDPVGHNLIKSGQDPLALGKELAGVVISHHHRDHVGGLKQQLRKTFRMPGDMLPECPIYLPKNLTHRFLTGEVLSEPKEILPGVAVTGPLPGWMFFLGNTPEQMLVINLEKGLLLVVGCGHPGAVQMARYAMEITGRPIFAFFGGVHALLDQSRSLQQRFIASKNPPWRPVTPDTIGIMATELSDLGIKKLFLSTHDSDDWAVSIFKTVFGKDLTILRVGEVYKF